jgi:MFS family permease
MFRPFRSSGYRWLWLSNAFGSAGRWALVLVLSSQLLSLTGSSFWVGLGLFLTQGPVVVFAPFSGIMADRIDRRTLNVLAAGLAAVVTGLFAALTWLGWLSLSTMLVLSFLYGIAFVFQLTSRSTLVPSLVEREDLLSGISLFQVGTQGAQFVGPAIAAALLVRGGPAAAWVLCAFLYGASALLSIPVSSVRGSTVSAGRRVIQLKASLEYLRLRPLAWVAIWAVSLHCALTMGYQGMLPMFVTTDLNASDAAYGGLLSSIGLGAVVGSAALARFSSADYRPILFTFSLIGSGVSLSIMGAAQTVPMAVVSGFFVGGTQAMFMSMALALIQGSVDDEFRGRATSLYQMITMAPMAVFGWGMGGLADITEPRPLMIVNGVIFVFAMGAYAAMSPTLRRMFTSRGWRDRESFATADSTPALVPIE